MKRGLTGFSDNPLVTRADAARAAESLVAPLAPHLERDGPLIDFGAGAAKFDMRAASLEGVARPLWGLVPLIAGGGRSAVFPLLLDAIARGTDPADPGYWGAVGDIDQRSVEMAAIGFMLAAIPEASWDVLPPPARDNLARWLADIQRRAMPQNNWLFFTVLVQQGLRRVGRGDLVDADVEAAYLARLTGWYLGDGWYGDGVSQAIDHYGGFAMHFYGLLYAWLNRDNPDAYADLFRARARAFAEPFRHWFAEDGEAMIQGRSLTYRFATAGFWAALAVAGETPLPMAEIRGLWARQIRLWRDRPIFTADGVLTRGYAYPNDFICEDYNSPTSPYWAMKAFLPLALPETDAFWQAGEAPLGPCRAVYPMPAAASLLQRVDGHAVVHYAAPIHHWLQIDKYNKFAYATLAGFDTDALQYARAGAFGDNILAFSFDDGANWQMRDENLAVTVSETALDVRWRSGDQSVDTQITPCGDGLFRRRHRFHLTRPALVVETGFAVAQWRADATRLPGPRDDGRVLAGETGLSGLRALDGSGRTPFDSARTNSNVQSPRTLVPGLRARLAAGEHTLEAVFVLAATMPAPDLAPRLAAFWAATPE